MIKSKTAAFLGAASVILVVANVQPANAGILQDLERGTRRTLRQIDPTNPNGSLGSDLHAKFKICNRTQVSIIYNVNSTRDRLASGYCRNWTTKGQAYVKYDYSLNDNRVVSQGRRVNDGNYFFNYIPRTQTLIQLYRE